MSWAFSGEKSGPEAVNSLYKQARAANYTACSKSTGLEYYENIGLNQLIFGVEYKEILKSFVNRQLAPLIDYDVENNTDYVETFKDYLESYSSVKTVSKKAMYTETQLTTKSSRFGKYSAESSMQRQKRLNF